MYNIEAKVTFCKDCQGVLERKKDSMLFETPEKAQNWVDWNLASCICKLLQGKGCKGSIQNYKGE